MFVWNNFFSLGSSSVDINVCIGLPTAKVGLADVLACIMYDVSQVGIPNYVILPFTAKCD